MIIKTTLKINTTGRDFREMFLLHISNHKGFYEEIEKNYELCQ